LYLLEAVNQLTISTTRLERHIGRLAVFEPKVAWIIVIVDLSVKDDLLRKNKKLFNVCLF